MGGDEGGRAGNDEGRAKKDGASTDMPRDASDGRISGLVSCVPDGPTFRSQDTS